jgi:hypothetical protein
MSRASVTFGGPVLGMGTCFWLLWKYRSRSPLILFAIPAVIGRLWMYHRRYDDAMLVFLLVPLGLLALSRRTPATLVSFLIVGLSLSAPPRDSDQTTAVILAKVLVWIVGLWHLLQCSEAGDGESGHRYLNNS